MKGRLLHCGMPTRIKARARGEMTAHFPVAKEASSAQAVPKETPSVPNEASSRQGVPKEVSSRPEA